MNQPGSKPVTPQNRSRLTASSLSRSTKFRTRQLCDLIQLAALYQEKGLFCELDPSHEDYADRACEELAVLVGIHHDALEGAKRIITLSGIRHNENTWQFLKKRTMLGIFADYNIIKVSEYKTGGVLCINFPEAFANGTKPQLHEGKLQKNRRELDKLALSYTAQARDISLSMFFKAVAVVATLCSFVPEDRKLDKLKVLDIIDRYFSDAWTSHARQKQYHLHASRSHSTDGLHLVSEVCKVQVQELKFWKERTTASTDTPTGEELKVTENDVTSAAHKWCHRVITEFFAWIFRFLVDKESVETFLECVSDVMSQMNEKLAEEMGCTTNESIPTDLITSTLFLIQRQAPTMAEVRYEGTRVTPTKIDCRGKRNIDWIPEEVLLRCRWEGTPVVELYDSYIKAATFGEQQQAGANELTGFSSVPESPVSGFVHPVPTAPTNVQDPLMVGKLRHSSHGLQHWRGNAETSDEFRGLKRTRPMQHYEAAHSEVPPRKKHYHAGPPGNRGITNPITRPSPNWYPPDDVPSFMNDGEDSEDEKAEIRFRGEMSRWKLA